jgi:CubicO group peptidase (beta-lactamase class C family)
VGAWAALAVGTVAPSVLAAAAPESAAVARVESALAPPVLVAGEPAETKTLAQTMAELHVPGLSVAYIHDGKVLWAHAWGVVQLSGAPVTPETRFQAASISKPVTALAVLQLVEAGRLDLDTDVNRYLTSWRVPDNTFTASEKVTLRRLLTHTAGVTVHGFAGYVPGSPTPTLLQVLKGEAPANSSPVTVDAVPGKAWRYSGGGYEIVQQILADVTGQPFPELMRQSVLQPAGMSRSTFEQPLPSTLLGEAAVPFDSNGQPIGGGAHVYPEMAAAGLWTTPSDLARLLIRVQADLNGESGGLLSPAMARTALAGGGLNDWGLGFQLGGSGDHLYFTHGGANEGFRSVAVAYQHGDGAVIMTNGDRGDELQDAVLRTLAQAYGWPDFQPPTRTIVSTEDKALEGYVGRYDFEEEKSFGLAITRQNGRLFAKLDGQEPYEVFPEGDRRFFYRIRDTELLFHVGPDGKADRVVWRQNGQDHPAARESGPVRTTVQPGTEAAIRRIVLELAEGEPRYDLLSPTMVEVTRARLPQLHAQIAALGPLQSLTFVEAGAMGADIYDVKFAKGELIWRILLGEDGKVLLAVFRPK